MSGHDDSLFEGLELGESAGVRTLYVTASSAKELADRIALAISEYAADDDELHISYSSQQVGWENDPGEPGTMWSPGRPPFTTLHIEYSSMIVLRPRPGARDRGES